MVPLNSLLGKKTYILKYKNKNNMINNYIKLIIYSYRTVELLMLENTLKIMMCNC